MGTLVICHYFEMDKINMNTADITAVSEKGSLCIHLRSGFRTSERFDMVYVGVLVWNLSSVIIDKYTTEIVALIHFDMHINCTNYLKCKLQNVWQILDIRA